MSERTRVRRTRDRWMNKIVSVAAAAMVTTGFVVPQAVHTEFLPTTVLASTGGPLLP